MMCEERDGICTVMIHKPRAWHGEKDNGIRTEVESDDIAWAIRDAIRCLNEPREELLLAQIIDAAFGTTEYSETTSKTLEELGFGVDWNRRRTAMQKMLAGATDLIDFFKEVDKSVSEYGKKPQTNAAAS